MACILGKFLVHNAFLEKDDRDRRASRTLPDEISGSCTEWMHATFSLNEPLKVTPSHMHWDPVLRTAIQDRDRKTGEDGILLYTLTRIFLLDNVKNWSILKNGCYWALSESCIGWTAAAMLVETAYTQNRLIPNISGLFLIGE